MTSHKKAAEMHSTGKTLKDLLFKDFIIDKKIEKIMNLETIPVIEVFQ